MIKSVEIALSCQGFCDIKNITDDVNKIVQDSQVENGIVVVFSRHSTAGLTIIEYEEGIIKDLCELLDKVVPRGKSYHHDRTWGDKNGFSHLRSSLMSSSLSIPLINRELQLGTWQQIVFCDFDNRPRRRKVIITILGE